MMKFTRKDSVIQTPSRERAPSPNVPIRSDEFGFERWEEGRRFAGGDIPLGDLGGCTQIGFNVVELVPGKQSCPFHWHQKEEEHFFVLEGRCILRSGDERHEMGPGDYVCFPAATRVAHCFENSFEAPCYLIAVGNRDRDEIAVYPDSRKAKFRALGLITPLPAGEGLEYWHGERPDEPLGSDEATALSLRHQDSALATGGDAG
jgi:uncharacterized cupin superfamily protein